MTARSGSSNTLIITGKPSGITTISAGHVTVIVTDKHTALSFWNVHIPGSSHTQYDQAPDVPSVLVFGPYLVRNATLQGSTLAINGDLNTTTTLQVIAPASVKSLTWNGQKVRTERSNGILQAWLSFDVQEPKLPNLKEATWYSADSLPEIQDDFADSDWVDANKTRTQRPYPPLGGKVRLTRFNKKKHD